MCGEKGERERRMKKEKNALNPARVKAGLKYCSLPLCQGSRCPYCGRGDCRQGLAKESLDVINNQEEEISGLKFELEKAKAVIAVLKEITGGKNERDHNDSGGTA